MPWHRTNWCSILNLPYKHGKSMVHITFMIFYKRTLHWSCLIYNPQVHIFEWMHVTHYIIPNVGPFEVEGEGTMVPLPSITLWNFTYISFYVKLMCKLLCKLLCIILNNFLKFLFFLVISWNQKPWNSILKNNLIFCNKPSCKRWKTKAYKCKICTWWQWKAYIHIDKRSLTKQTLMFSCHAFLPHLCPLLLPLDLIV